MPTDDKLVYQEIPEDKERASSSLNHDDFT